MHGMNSPAMAAAHLYAGLFGDDGREYMSFGQMLDGYLVNGYVISTPEYFICARPVPREAPAEQIINPVYPFDHKDCDAWFVGLLAGNLRLVWTYYPHSLEYCGYQRKGSPIRWVKTSKLRRYNDGLETR